MKQKGTIKSPIKKMTRGLAVLVHCTFQEKHRMGFFKRFDAGFLKKKWKITTANYYFKFFMKGKSMPNDIFQYQMIEKEAGSLSNDWLMKKNKNFHSVKEIIATSMQELKIVDGQTLDQFISSPKKRVSFMLHSCLGLIPYAVIISLLINSPSSLKAWSISIFIFPLVNSWALISLRIKKSWCIYWDPLPIFPLSHAVMPTILFSFIFTILNGMFSFWHHTIKSSPKRPMALMARLVVVITTLSPISIYSISD